MQPSHNAYLSFQKSLFLSEFNLVRMFSDKSDEEETFENLVSSKKRKMGSEAGSVKSRMTTASR